jgi:hypothetical protein
VPAETAVPKLPARRGGRVLERRWGVWDSDGRQEGCAVRGSGDSRMLPRLRGRSGSASPAGKVCLACGDGLLQSAGTASGGRQSVRSPGLLSWLRQSGDGESGLLHAGESARWPAHACACPGHEAPGPAPR